MKYKLIVAILLFSCPLHLLAAYTKDDVAEFRKRAEAGNHYAQNSLGYCYSRGEGVRKDKDEAIKWQTLSAEQGNGVAQYNLGLNFIGSYYSYENDYSEAAAWFAAAQVNGYTEASGQWSRCVNRLSLHQLARSQEQAEDIATKHLQNWQKKPKFQSASTAKLLREIKLIIYDELVSDATPCAIPREKYGSYDGPATWRDGVLVRAFEECLKLANEGNAGAQFGLSLKYEVGDGILKNEVEAKRWLIVSAKQGYMPAIRKTGVHRYAFHLHQKGDLEATYYLSKHTSDTAHFFGTTYVDWRSPDYVAYCDLTRVDFLTTAAKGGHSEAMYELALYYLKKADYESAYFWFGSSASINPDSAMMTGFLRGMGWGCPKNYEAGFLYLLSAYNNQEGQNSDFTPEMFNLASGAISEHPHRVNCREQPTFC